MASVIANIGQLAGLAKDGRRHNAGRSYANEDSSCPVNRKVVSQKMLQLSADRGTCLDLVAVYPSTDALWARCQAQTHHLSCRTGRLNNCV
jgi:hypothetical protein